MTESPAQTLARSAFGFAIVAFLPALLTWLALLFFVEASPSPTFRTIQLGIQIGFGIFVLLLPWLCRYFYSTPQKINPSFRENRGGT